MWLINHNQGVNLTYLAAVVDEGVHGSPDGRVGNLTLLHLGFEVVLVVGPHHDVVVPPLIHCHLGFGLDHRVDPSHCTVTHSEGLK